MDYSTTSSEVSTRNRNIQNAQGNGELDPSRLKPTRLCKTFCVIMLFFHYIMKKKKQYT